MTSTSSMPASTRMRSRWRPWEDLIAVGKQVIEGNPDFYLDDDGNFKRNFIKLPMYFDDTWSMQVLTTFLAQTGGSVLNADRTKATINEPAGVEAVEWMMRVSHELGDPNIGPVIPGDVHAAFGSGGDDLRPGRSVDV